MKGEDYLNFILFSGDVITWKDDLVQATPENIEEARIFVKNIHDRGCKEREGRADSSDCSSWPEQPAFFVPWGRDAAGPSSADPSWGSRWDEGALRLNIGVSSLWA